MQIDTIDLNFQGRPQCVASFVVRGPAGNVLVETGPSSTLPALQSGLAAINLQPCEIHAVLLTHIHLDHAGAAWWWASQGIPVYVHPLGAPHLIDPSRLLASATRIYGDQMDTLWGELRPCPAEQVRATEPDSTFRVAGLEWEAIDTPGHAKHHLSFKLGDLAFTGDVAGVRLPGAEWVSVPAPPPEFDRETWLTSIEKLKGHNLREIYPTHFGLIEDPAAHFRQLSTRVQAVAGFVGEHLREPREQLVQEYYDWTRSTEPIDDATFDRYEKANPLFMSVDGLVRYWAKKNR